MENIQLLEKLQEIIIEQDPDKREEEMVLEKISEGEET